MNRRNFIYNTSLATSAALMGLKNAGPVKPAYKMGLQLFTVRKPLAEDLFGTIKQIAAIGYRDTETYGFDPAARSYYDMPAGSFRQLLSDNGLTTTSGHYDFSKYFDKDDDDLMWYTDQCIEGARKLGQAYITWPWLDPAFRSIENFKKLAEKLNTIGERVKRAGIGFAYHNHDFEFTEYDGQTGYDIILNETDPEVVKLQIDLYWVMHSSKRSPSELFDLFPGRFVMWHIKDMDKNSRDYTELGNGSIDYTTILPHAKRSGMQYYYIEQGGNFATDPMQSIRESAAFFKTNLQKYLG